MAKIIIDGFDVNIIKQTGSVGHPERFVFYEINEYCAKDELNYGEWSSAIKDPENLKLINTALGSNFEVNPESYILGDEDTLLVCKPVDGKIIYYVVEYLYAM